MRFGYSGCILSGLLLYYRRQEAGRIYILQDRGYPGFSTSDIPDPGIKKTTGRDRLHFERDRYFH